MYVRNRSSWPRSAVASRSSSQGSSPIAAASPSSGLACSAWPRSPRIRSARCSPRSPSGWRSPSRVPHGRSPPGCPGRVSSRSPLWASPGTPRSRSRRRASPGTRSSTTTSSTWPARAGFRTRTCPSRRSRSSWWPCSAPRRGRSPRVPPWSGWRGGARGAIRWRRRGSPARSGRSACWDSPPCRRSGCRTTACRRTRRSRCSPRVAGPRVAGRWRCCTRGSSLCWPRAARSLGRRAARPSHACSTPPMSPPTRPRRPARVRRSIPHSSSGCSASVPWCSVPARWASSHCSPQGVCRREEAVRAGTHRPPPPW